MALPEAVNIEKLKKDVQLKFETMRKALNVRERLLLRQIDVIVSSRQHNCRNTNDTQLSEEIEFIIENEENVLNAIRSFGRFNLNNINYALQDLYMNEDYISPANDHETMYKCLSKANTANNDNGNQESIVIDLSTNNKLIRENVNNMYESIINITVNEAKKLIQESKGVAVESDVPSKVDGINNCDEDDDGMLPSTSSKSSQTEVHKEKHSFKPKITINNCNGTINLRNISNLTINCATKGSYKGSQGNDQLNNDQPSKSITITNSTSNSSVESSQISSTGNSASSSHVITPKQHSDCRPVEIECNDDDRSATCEFYNRLLNEIKRSLKTKTPKIIHKADLEGDEDDDDDNVRNEKGQLTSTTEDDNGNDTSTTSEPPMQPNRKLVLRNFENLKVVLEGNDANDSMHPVQIEQWLAEIISETEIEPMQNTDILEYSRIHNETC